MSYVDFRIEWRRSSARYWLFLVALDVVAGTAFLAFAAYTDSPWRCLWNGAIALVYAPLAFRAWHHRARLLADADAIERGAA